MGLTYLARQTSPAVAAAGVLAPLVAGFLAAGLIRIIDHRSIASSRRLFGLFFVSTVIWIVPLVIGLVAADFGLTSAGINEFVFGAFLAWGFETIVINGAFIASSPTSLALGAIHPIPILLIVLSATGHLYLYPAVTGLLAMALMMAFLLRLEGLKTRRGVPALRLLRAFLKTWVGHNPEDLEGYFSSYANKERVATDVMVAEGGQNKVVFVLPGVHPGPFYPVGSYNLSELIYRALADEGASPVVLHGTGGHERNTPANSQAASYAAEISGFVSSLNASERMMRGPVYDKIGITNITSMAFGKGILSILSNSPFLSDDLDPKTITEASDVASKLGFTLSMIDAHNSVDGESRPQTQITKDAWEAMFTRLLALPERAFSIGFASSTKTNLKLGPDVSEGGINVALFSTQESKNALVCADSNNAVSCLRERIAEALGKDGIGFLELCTSDTHSSAARGLTDRGYLALGEGTGMDAVIEAVSKLAGIAESNIAPCDFVLARFETETPLIGSESLDEFAGLTKNAISYSKTYAKLLGLTIVVLAAITLFY